MCRYLDANCTKYIEYYFKATSQYNSLERKRRNKEKNVLKTETLA